MADNQNQEYWDAFYASIYGPAAAPATPPRALGSQVSPQAALAYGLVEEPPISDMVRSKQRTMLGGAPVRLAQNVGTPATGTVTPTQAASLGWGLGNSVNALGYRTAVPPTMASAVAAIDTAAPVATVGAAPVVTARGSSPSTTPRWIAAMSAPPPVTFQGVHTGRSYTAGQTYAGADGHQAVANDDGTFSRITSSGSVRPRVDPNYDYNTGTWR
jgi:hypothetical protein